MGYISISEKHPIPGNREYYLVPSRTFYRVDRWYVSKFIDGDEFEDPAFRTDKKYYGYIKPVFEKSETNTVTGYKVYDIRSNFIGTEKNRIDAALLAIVHSRF